jgi:hypothetical protein
MPFSIFNQFLKHHHKKWKLLQSGISIKNGGKALFVEKEESSD